MATIKETGAQIGDVVVAGWAWKELANYELSGIPLDTSGATIEFGIYRVLELDAPCGAGLGTKLEALINHNVHRTCITIGNIRTIHNGFVNFVSEGDYRLQKELEGAGFRVQGYRERDGRVTFEIINENDENQFPRG